MSRIVIKTGQGPPKVVALPHEGVVCLGTSPSCEVSLDDPDVRSRHCALKCTGGKVGLIVIDSTAGAQVNGEPVRKKVLEEGDLIRIGKSTIRVHIDGRDPFVGRSIAGYRIEEKLGKGAMGTVYRAKQVSLDRTVALKILSARFGNDAEFVRAFLKEARAVARLSHPRVVHVHDAGQEEGRFYFSMEYLPGGTLEDRLRRDGALPLAEALRYARDAAEALVWAEQQGIVHRDVKPGNLLLAADGTVKLGDLGIAIDRSTDSKPSRKAGSPAYMAPEQARAGPIDHRADVYGLGSTLFHLLSGKLPFAQANTAEMIKAKVAEEPRHLESVLPDAPREVSSLIRGMIARDPDRRFGTCLEMLEAIEKALVVVTGAPLAPDAGRGRRAISVPRRDRRRAPRSMMLTTIVIAAAVAISVGVLEWRRARPDGDEQDPGWPDRPGVTVERAAGDSDRDVAPRGEARDDRDFPGNASDRIETFEGEESSATELDANAFVGAPVDEPPEVSPLEAVSEERQLAVLKELGAIRRKWLAGVVESPKALQLIGRFQKRHPEPVYGESIASVLREIGEKVTAASRKRVELELDVVRPRLERADYAGARLLLVELMKRFPEHAKLIESEVQKVDLASEGLWTSTVAMVDDLVDGGDFEGGRRSLERLQASLPPSFKGRVLEKVAVVEAARGGYWNEASRLHEDELSIRAAVSRAGFETARAVARGKSFSDSPGGRILANRWSLVIEDIERCGAAWARLVMAIEHVADRRRIVELRHVNGPENESVPARLRELRAGTLSFRTTGEQRTESVELLSLCDENLLDLTLEGLRAEGSEEEGEAIEALGALLLYAKGPLRPAVLFSDSRIEKSRRAEREKRLEIELGHFLGQRVHALTVERDRLGERLEKKGGSKDADEWAELARRAGSTISEYRRTDAYRRSRTRLAAIYIEAGVNLLRQTAPQNLFHTERAETKAGTIRLSYRFQDEAELLDFRRVGSAGAITLGEAGLRLTGECRLLRGNPFRGRIVVEVRVSADRYDGDSPNINVALWTHDGDRVSARSDGDAPAPGGAGRPGDGLPGDGLPGDGLPGDYAVFGIGYRVPSGTLPVAGAGGEKVAMPADVFMGGVRGASLGTFPSSECVWAASAAGRKRNQTLRIAMTPKTLIWKVNGDKMPMTPRQLDRFIKETPRTGSVTLFTNGSTVEYSSLTVTGVLNPAWIEEEIQARAMESLRGIEPDYPF